MIQLPGLHMDLSYATRHAPQIKEARRVRKGLMVHANDGVDPIAYPFEQTMIALFTIPARDALIVPGGTGMYPDRPAYRRASGASPSNMSG